MVNKKQPWNYNYYAVDKDSNELIYGFDDMEEAKFYSKINNFKVLSQKTLKKMDIDPSNYGLWSENYPDFDEKAFVAFK